MLPAVLAMRPHYVEKLWGGARLAGLPAKQRAGHVPPDGARVGESWEVADLPEGCSVVDGGPLDGWTLREAVARFGAELVGDAAPGEDERVRFPLLLKLIDAGDDLSVQVHPDAAYARAHPGVREKDEAWLVVDVAAGARVLHGTRDGVTPESFRAAIAAGTADRALREVRVTPGDILRIEPGTLHAVGRGCLLLEIQQPSDTTFRVWDFNRTDKDGRPRPLHVEEALAVARFGPQGPPLVNDARPGRTLVEAPGYRMALVEVPAGGRAAVPVPAGTPGAVFALRGTAQLGAVGLPTGAAAVVAASAREVVAESGDGATLVVCTGP